MNNTPGVNVKFVDWLIKHSRDCEINYCAGVPQVATGTFTKDLAIKSRMIRFLNIEMSEISMGKNLLPEEISYAFYFEDFGNVDEVIVRKLEEVRMYRLCDSFPDEYHWWMSVMGGDG